MKIVHRDVSDTDALPDCHVAHYYLDKAYVMSMKDDVLYLHDPEPEWPGA